MDILENSGKLPLGESKINGKQNRTERSRAALKYWRSEGGIRISERIAVHALLLRSVLLL